MGIDDLYDCIKQINANCLRSRHLQAKYFLVWQAKQEVLLLTSSLSS
jgi:hypothetical protein